MNMISFFAQQNSWFSLAIDKNDTVSISFRENFDSILNWKLSQVIIKSDFLLLLF